MSAERNISDVFVLFLSLAVKFANNVKGGGAAIVFTHTPEDAFVS